MKYNIKNKRIILFVGRLVKYKGIEYLFKAMVKANCNKMTIGKTERVIPSEGEMWEILKEHHKDDESDIKIGFA